MKLGCRRLRVSLCASSLWPWLSPRYHAPPSGGTTHAGRATNAGLLPRPLHHLRGAQAPRDPRAAPQSLQQKVFVEGEQGRAARGAGRTHERGRRHTQLGEGTNAGSLPRPRHHLGGAQAPRDQRAPPTPQRQVQAEGGQARAAGHRPPGPHVEDIRTNQAGRAAESRASKELELLAQLGPSTGTSWMSRRAPPTPPAPTSSSRSHAPSACTSSTA